MLSFMVSVYCTTSSTFSPTTSKLLPNSKISWSACSTSSSILKKLSAVCWAVSLISSVTSSKSSGLLLRFIFSGTLISFSASALSTICSMPSSNWVKSNTTFALKGASSKLPSSAISNHLQMLL